MERLVFALHFFAFAYLVLGVYALNEAYVLGEAPGILAGYPGLLVATARAIVALGLS